MENQKGSELESEIPLGVGLLMSGQTKAYLLYFPENKIPGVPPLVRWNLIVELFETEKIKKVCFNLQRCLRSIMHYTATNSEYQPKDPH